MRFEFFKIIKNKLLIVGFFLSVGITIYYSYANYKINESLGSNDEIIYNEKYSDELYQELEREYNIIESRYQLIQGKVNMFGQDMSEVYKIAGMTEKEVKELSEDEKTDIINKFTCYKVLFGKAEDCKKTLQYRNDVINNAKRLKNSDDIYISRTNKKILKLFYKNPQLAVTNETVTNKIIQKWKTNEYSDYINIVLMILVICMLFLTEHQNKTYNMIYSSYKGRGRTYINKISVIVIFDIIIAISTTFFSNICCLFNKDCVLALRLCIQNKEDFYSSPYVLSVYQLWIIIGLLRILGYITLSLLFVFITLFIKKSIVPFVANTIIGVGGYAVFDKLIIRMRLLESQERSIESIVSKINKIRTFTPYAFLRDGISYFKVYEPNNFMNYPVSTLALAVWINIIYCVILFALGYFVYIKRFRKKY